MVWEIPRLVEGVIWAAVIGTVGYVGSRAVVGRMKHRGAARVYVQAVRAILWVLTIGVAIAVVLAFAGPISIVSGLTASAVLGIALTLALQTTLSNLIAGFLLLRRRMLRIDDLVTVSGVTGRVVDLGLVTVLLRLDDGAIASVSNSSLLSGPFVNRSAAPRLKDDL